MRKTKGGKKGVKNKLEVRNAVKVVFVKKYSALFEKAGKNYLAEEARFIVREARKLIGYSDKSGSCDVYWSLWRTWKKQIENGMHESQVRV